MNIRKDMSWKEKLDYVWTYYKGWFIAPIILFLIIGVFCSLDGGEQKETALNAVVINQFLLTEDVEKMEADMLAALRKDEAASEVYVDAAIELDLENQSGDTMTNLSKITAYIFGKELDFMIAEPEIVNHYQGLNGLADVSEYFTEEQCAFYYDSDGNACGICLEGTKFVDDYGIELNNPVLCIIHNSNRIPNTLQIIDWILEKE